MKKITLLLVTIVLSQTAFAQQTDASLEKNLFAWEVGLLGSWVTYEQQLGDQLVVNAQLGLDGGFFGSSGDFNYAFVPTISIEPRWYYNFNRRAIKGKKVINNSANYFALDGTYVSDLFVITNEEGTEAVPTFLLLPKWGLKRTLGQRVTFNFAVGYGVSFWENTTEGQIGLDLKFGYVFK